MKKRKGDIIGSRQTVQDDKELQQKVRIIKKDTKETLKNGIQKLHFIDFMLTGAKILIPTPC